MSPIELLQKIFNFQNNFSDGLNIHNKMLMDGLDFFNEFLMDCKLTNGLFLVHLLI